MISPFLRRYAASALSLLILAVALPAGCSSSNVREVGDVSPAIFVAEGVRAPKGGSKIEGHYFNAKVDDLVAMLPPPPSPDSIFQYGDVEMIKAVMDDASSAAKARAASVDDGDSVWDFAPAMGAGFSESSCPAIAALFKNADADSKATVKALKNHWERARPPTGKPDPKDFAYPSGHSSRAAVRAALLSAIAPEKADQVRAIARQAALNRVVLGKHYTSDAAAGLGLGNYIGQQMLAGSAISADLAAAKAEWAKVSGNR